MRWGQSDVNCNQANVIKPWCKLSSAYILEDAATHRGGGGGPPTWVPESTCGTEIPLLVYLVKISWPRTKPLFGWLTLLSHLSGKFYSSFQASLKATFPMEPLQIGISIALWISGFVCLFNIYLILPNITESLWSIVQALWTNVPGFKSQLQYTQLFAAAAAAKSLQSSPTLCDPRSCSALGKLLMRFS